MPPPWTVSELPEAFKVTDSTGKDLAYVYFVPERLLSSSKGSLSKEEARRVAVNIAKLPELLKRSV